MGTLYDTLHLLPGASDKQIHSAYRVLASELHPDVNKSADAAQRFKQVQAAYDVLGNPEARRAYDDGLRRASANPSSTPPAISAGVSRRRSAVAAGVIGFITVALLTFAAIGRPQEVQITSRSTPTSKPTAIPTATADPRAAELMAFAEDYRVRRKTDEERSAEFNKLYPPFPDHRLSDAEATARALQLAGFYAAEADVTNTTVRRLYEGLSRTPATRRYIDNLSLLIDKRVEKSKARRDLYRVIAGSNDQATIDGLSATIDLLDKEIDRMWLQLEDDIEDGLVAYGLSWASVGGRP
jgi:curved DNA-binding protein CbpA